MMALKHKTHEIEKAPTAQRAPEQQETLRAANEHTRPVNPAVALQRVANSHPSALKPADLLVLQRTVGNRAVRRIFSNRTQAQAPKSSTPENAVQRKTEEEETLQAKLENERELETGRGKENRTGLPDRLKAGIERLSGMAMGDVSVHYNSSKPAQVQALAYTQGANIHLGPGEEEHLPHEAWHVVQQKQGRVKPTLQAKGVAINDDDGLEREATAQGAKALLLGQLRENAGLGAQAMRSSSSPTRPHPATVVQRVGTLTVTDIDYNPETDRHINKAIMMDKYGPALVRFVTANLDLIAPPGTTRTERRLQGPLRTQITNDAAGYAAWADLQDVDVDKLVTRIVNHLLRNPGEGQVNAAALRPGVENAVRHGLPSAASDSTRPERERSDLTETEIGAVEAVLDAATTKSSAKGVPNVVPFASLNGAVDGLGDAVQTVRNLIAGRNRLLFGRMGREMDLMDQAALGGAAGLDLGVRSMHQNGAGWLPPGAVVLPTTLDALVDLIITARNALYTDQIRARIAALPNAARSRARLAIESQAVGQVVNALPVRTRVMLIWGSYAQNQGALMNYVEFHIAARINRMMYDYVNGRFYITAHYNWYKGYNPFFQITGLRDL
jgi:hypothetical protein